MFEESYFYNTAYTEKHCLERIILNEIFTDKSSLAPFTACV